LNLDPQRTGTQSELAASLGNDVLIIDAVAAIGDRGAKIKSGAGVAMDIGKLAISGALAAALSLLSAGAEAQTAPQGTRVAQGLTADDLAARPVDRAARPPRRIRVYPRYQAEPEDVYPRYFPGSNAVRVCSASYAPEYRPSGTVIVPHMTCVWRGG
jgi:hypothetical protein